MITIDDLQKIYDFGMAESSHHYRCLLNANNADDRQYHFGADYGTRVMVEKIYLLIEREKKAEGSK